jgi:thiosulfate dehydrogenase [quinone] large subunit
MNNKADRFNNNLYWPVLRIALGMVFFWAFIDKVFGLGFSTCRDKAGSVEIMCSESWLKGGSPTYEFLKFATKDSPLSSIFQSMAGNPLWDWLFMAGLAGLGLALILGIGLRLAAYSGTLMMALMYIALFQPENNPALDEHVIYALVMLGLSQSKSARRWSLYGWWSKQKIVKKYPILE